MIWISPWLTCIRGLSGYIHVGDEICWWQFYYVGNDFRHFIFTFIFYLSPTFKKLSPTWLSLAELALWTIPSVTICVCLFIAIFFKILNMVLEYRKKKSNRPDEIVYLVSSSNRPRGSRIDEGWFSSKNSNDMTHIICVLTIIYGFTGMENVNP